MQLQAKQQALPTFPQKNPMTMMMIKINTIPISTQMVFIKMPDTITKIVMAQKVNLQKMNKNS